LCSSDKSWIGHRNSLDMAEKRNISGLPGYNPDNAANITF